MTLHVITITPEHILSVSDRLISTSGGLMELENDRFKHVTLQTEDARAVISFAGFAGILERDGKVNQTTADWLTTVLNDTLKVGHHGINEHITDVKDRTIQYLSQLRVKFPWIDRRMAIIISGWAGSNAFNCVIDNCIEPDLKWSKEARDSVKVRKREYVGGKFPDGCYILFPINAWIAKKYTGLHRFLQSKAIQEDVEGIFDASVQIIRASAADPESCGTIGTKCSGINMPKNMPVFRALHDREDSRTWTVIPNHVISTSHLKVVHQNDEVHRPKPAAKLVYLIAPTEADTQHKLLAFWQRAVEKLRLLHNKYGEKARSKNLEYTLKRFHKWQHENYEPVSKAAQNEMNQVILQLQEQDPDRYGSGELAKPIFILKQKISEIRLGTILLTFVMYPRSNNADNRSFLALC